MMDDRRLAEEMDLVSESDENPSESESDSDDSDGSDIIAVGGFGRIEVTWIFCGHKACVLFDLWLVHHCMQHCLVPR